MKQRGGMDSATGLTCSKLPDKNSRSGGRQQATLPREGSWCYCASPAKLIIRSLSLIQVKIRHLPLPSAKCSGTDSMMANFRLLKLQPHLWAHTHTHTPLATLLPACCFVGIFLLYLLQKTAVCIYRELHC